MRKPFVAGNWKMNKSVAQAQTLVTELVPELKKITGVEQVFCPPFTALSTVAALLKDTGIGLGAQNMHWEASGAYTGEVAPSMVAEFCQYVILGHSERRTYFGETDETVNRKTLAALANGLIPIVCVGETLTENEAGQTSAVIERQVREGLKNLPAEKIGSVVIAYEPVWAIGTGKACAPVPANDVVAKMIRPAFAALYGAEAAQAVRVLYGGSVTGANAADFFAQPDIDGALVGGASLKPDFIQIVRAAVG